MATTLFFPPNVAPIPAEVVKMNTVASDIVQTVDEIIKARETLETKLDKVITDAKNQERDVNISKGVSTATAVISTILLFTPLAPIGGLGLAGSAAVQLGTTITDLVLTNINTGEVQGFLDTDREKCSRVNRLVDELNVLCTTVTTKFPLKSFTAAEIAFASAEILGNATAIGGGVAAALNTGTAAAKVGEAVTRSISSVSTAASESSIAILEAASSGASKAASGVSATASVASRALGVVGAVVSVADLIWSLTKENTTVTQVQQAQERLKTSTKALVDVQEGVRLAALATTLKAMAEARKKEKNEKKNPGGLLIFAGDSNLRRLLSTVPRTNGGKARLDEYRTRRNLRAVHTPVQRIDQMEPTLAVIVPLLPFLRSAFDSVKVCVCTGWSDLDALFWNQGYRVSRNWSASVPRLVEQYGAVKQRYANGLTIFVYSHNTVYADFVSGASPQGPWYPQRDYRRAADDFAQRLERAGVNVFRGAVDMDMTSASWGMKDGHLGPASEPRFAQWLIALLEGMPPLAR